jgi:glycerol uptake facilitator-like aquaporin
VGDFGRVPWSKEVAIFLILALGSLFGSGAWLYLYYAAISPTESDPATGQIYPTNLRGFPGIHGHVIFVTLNQNRILEYVPFLIFGTICLVFMIFRSVSKSRQGNQE